MFQMIFKINQKRKSNERKTKKKNISYKTINFSLRFVYRQNERKIDYDTTSNEAKTL